MQNYVCNKHHQEVQSIVLELKWKVCDIFSEVMPLCFLGLNLPKLMKMIGNQTEYETFFEIFGHF